MVFTEGWCCAALNNIVQLRDPGVPRNSPADIAIRKPSQSLYYARGMHAPIS